MKAYVEEIDGYMKNLVPGDVGANWACVGGYDHPHPASRLLYFGMGWKTSERKLDNPSVIYANFYDANTQGNVVAPSADVLAYCRDNNIRRIVVGHQPIGDAPHLIATEDLMVSCICSLVRGYLNRL